jgi:hypothetical protein
VIAIVAWAIGLLPPLLLRLLYLKRRLSGPRAFAAALALGFLCASVLDAFAAGWIGFILAYLILSTGTSDDVRQPGRLDAALGVVLIFFLLSTFYVATMALVNR